MWTRSQNRNETKSVCLNVGLYWVFVGLIGVSELNVVSIGDLSISVGLSSPLSFRGGSHANANSVAVVLSFFPLYFIRPRIDFSSPLLNGWPLLFLFPFHPFMLVLL